MIVPKDYQGMRRCLRDLGYTSRRGKHEVWSKDGQANFTLPLTPSDYRSFANDLARLRRRHPEVFDAASPAPRERVRLVPAPALPSDVAAQVRERRREARQIRRSLRAAEQSANGQVPNPGSPEAVTAGCVCPAYENHHGEGIDRDGETFAYVKGCPVHVAEWAEEGPPLEAVLPQPVGFGKYERRGRGRPAGTGRSPGCARCGHETDGRVALHLERTGGSRVAGRSVAFCEPCAVGVFDRLLAAFSKSYEPPVEEAA